MRRNPDVVQVLVRDITTTADGRYGLAVGADDQSFEGGKPASSAGSLEVDRLRIEHAAFVGIGYVRTGGSLARSEVHDSGVAVYLSKGASPRIDASNRFVGNADNRISFGDALELPGPTTIPQRP